MFDHVGRICPQCGQNYLCQSAPLASPGFLLVTFGTVEALTSFEFSKSGWQPLNARLAGKYETQEFPPRCRHAHSFQILSASECFLIQNSASWSQLFLPPYCCTSSCKYLTLWKFQSIALRYSEKGNLPDPFVRRANFFFCYAILTSIWTYKTADLPDHQLMDGSFLWAIASMGRTKQTPRRPWFFK